MSIKLVGRKFLTVTFHVMCRKLTVFMAILIFVTATCEALDCTNPEVPETTKCLEVSI